MSIHVFIADDHAVVRDGLRFLLEAQKDITVIGQAANGREAVRKVSRLNPHVVLMDVGMPDLNGIEATKQIREGCPPARVIILSMHHSSEHIFRAMNAGARGYVLKESAGAEVIAAVRAVHVGKCYLSRKISERIWDAQLGRNKGMEVKDPLATLSQREREVLQLVVEGKKSSEIAGSLFLSSKTVDTYRSRLMKKLNIKNIPDLTKFAIQHGFITLERTD